MTTTSPPRTAAAWAAGGLALGLAMAAAIGEAHVAPVMVVTGVLLVSVIAPDLRERRIPNRTLLVAGPALVATVLAAGLLGDELDRSLVALSTGVVLFGGLLLAAIAVPTGLGMGDVKLIGLGSVGVGWLGLQAALVATALAFGLAGIVGLVARRTGRWSDGVPFAPFYAAGAAATVLLVGAGA